MATVGDAVLILAQEGAEVEPVLSAWHRSVDEPSVMVLQQAAGETLTEFKRRLHLRLAGIELGGRGIERGAFVAKSGFGLPDVLATVALLSSMVAAMVAMGIGRVYLCGHAGDTRAGVALEALADAMRDQVRGTGVEVVTEESAQSGLHVVAAGVRAGRASFSRA
ncbi:MAG: hypothetical protein JWN04_4534 [Myxococcaceae bacterium]|nr:hypothetical protein [Myxococcaceae bacterium]